MRVSAAIEPDPKHAYSKVSLILTNGAYSEVSVESPILSAYSEASPTLVNGRAFLASKRV